MAFCAAALAATFLENRGAGAAAVSDNGITAFVNDQYALLAKGKYEELSRGVVEGLWSREPSGYHFDGVMPAAESAQRLEDDLGVGAWRLRFVSLKAIGFTVLSRPDFRKSLRREAEILDAIDPDGKISTVAVVTMKGHNTGRCSIVEWERQVPVVEKDGRRLILMRGAPAVYELVHNEQWFQPVRF